MSVSGFASGKSSALRENLRQWFPQRELFMRANGQVRFVRISTRVQVGIAGLICLALLGWLGLMAALTFGQFYDQFERNQLLEREARVASAEERVQAYRADVDAVANDLNRRQMFLESMVDNLPNDMQVDANAPANDTVTDSSTEASKTVNRVSAVMPEAESLARLEARQLAFVERLTRIADARTRRSARAIRRLGLTPSAKAASNYDAMGGPFEQLTSLNDDNIDPRFERLALSIARMRAMEQSLMSIPQVAPASVEMVSSSYGLRRDPINGHAAMHKGLDFRGPTGAPIYAAANGVVTFAGRQSGYGNIVEITHGNGLTTRYAHMSRLGAFKGQRVSAGDRIGAIGSTGRSTGPHLHFEVRINKRAVDPRPFLETAPHVLKEARTGTGKRR